MLIGYARTSTLDQTYSLEAQKEALQGVGADKLFTEQVSSVDKDNRTKLNEAIDYLREGDTLLVTRLDRLARSTKHLLELVDQIKARKAHLKVLDPAIDTSSPTGGLILTVLAGIAQFEREVMLERQREGIARAKGAGKYKGRKPTALVHKSEIRRLAEQGMPKTEIAKTLGVSRSSVYNALAS
jgi:DNA invertase Pin-like site-specific DNA recombinase